MKKLLAGVTLLSLSLGICAQVSADDKPKPKVSPEERFKKLDKNSDMKLSFDEFKGKQTDEEKVAAAKKNFEAKDANKDMFLTLEEFKAPVKKKKKDA